MRWSPDRGTIDQGGQIADLDHAVCPSRCSRIARLLSARASMTSCFVSASSVAPSTRPTSGQDKPLARARPIASASVFSIATEARHDSRNEADVSALQSPL